MNRHALGIKYLGTSYFGWQSQKSVVGIQNKVEHAIEKIANEFARVHCAGRTDRGVHATNQVVHFDSSAIRDSHGWVRGVNAYLPDDIEVLWHLPVSNDFHAKYGAKLRKYTYLIYHAKNKNIFWQDRALMVNDVLDLEEMQLAADQLIGEHDFTSFRASGCQSMTPVKHIHSIQIKNKLPWIKIEFKANAFLYHMIRIIVAALILVATGKKTKNWLNSALKAHNRAIIPFMVPAHGLYFQGAEYSQKYEIPQNLIIMDGVL